MQKVTKIVLRSLPHIYQLCFVSHLFCWFPGYAMADLLQHGTYGPLSSHEKQSYMVFRYKTVVQNNSKR